MYVLVHHNVVVMSASFLVATVHKEYVGTAYGLENMGVMVLTVSVVEGAVRVCIGYGIVRPESMSVNIQKVLQHISVYVEKKERHVVEIKTVVLVSSV